MGDRRLVYYPAGACECMLPRGRGAGSRLAIQTILENGMQGCVGAGIDLQGPFTGSLKALMTKGFGQPQNAQTRPVSLFGMTPLAHDDLNIDFRVGADLCGLPAYAFWRPVRFEAVMGGHVIFMGGMLTIAGAANMGSHAFAFKIYLYGARRDPGP